MSDPELDYKIAMYGVGGDRPEYEGEGEAPEPDEDTWEE